MRLVVVGLSLASSWGNGHATTYRALLGAFAARGHEVLFLEREAPWYAATTATCRSPASAASPSTTAWRRSARWRAEIATADAVIVGSYTPQGVEVGRFVQATARGRHRLLRHRHARHPGQARRAATTSTSRPR